MEVEENGASSGRPNGECSRPFLPMKLSFLILGLMTLVATGAAENIVTLPGTQPLTMTGDLSAQMHEAALRDMDRRIAEAPAQRAKVWQANSAYHHAAW